MTRWARSKSILKHERQPGEATTWSEFVAQRQQQEDVTKQDVTRCSAGTLGLTNAATKVPEDNGTVSVKRKGDAVCAKRAATKLSAQASQQGIKNKDPVKVEGKDPVKERGTSMGDKEAELLEAVLKKHTTAQQVPDISQGRPATVPKQSMAAENTASHKAGTFSKKNITRVSPSMKSKAQLPKRKKNACAVESALPAAVKRSFVSGESEGLGGTKEMLPSALVPKVAPKKRKAAAKRAIASAREGLPLDEKEVVMSPSPKKMRTIKDEKQVVKSPSPKKMRTVKGKALSKKAVAVHTDKDEMLLHMGKSEEQGEDNEEEGQPPPRWPRESHGTSSGGRKAERLQRLRQEREAKGMLLLPEKVERHIYLVKKAMRKKGLPGDQIKEAVRKMRRKEELLFRRKLAKLCFKCRQPGHKVSECPQMLQDSSEAVGICFKCGSTEHFSSTCSVQTSKDNEFPYAKCFICKQQGHLSRKCPRNEKGVYPKGGHCNFCGAIDHFKRECPEMQKNKSKGNEESDVAADIASVDQSADAENIAPLGQHGREKKAKVVSF